MKLYLSPSNQPHNAYSGINTNEKAEMEAVAHRVKSLLENNYIVEVAMATLSMGINKNERPTECKNKGCDFYLAIHSNAGGGGKASGAVGFYHPDSEIAKALATALVKELNAVCPYKSNRSSDVQNGMKQFNGAGYGEIRSPMQLGIPSALVEVNFHDNEPIAKWIVANKDTIAEAIVKSIVSTFNLKKKSGESKPVTPSKTLYRVQVGAYLVKANAEAQLKKVKAAGFDTYMVNDGKYYKIQVGAYSVKANADAMLKKIQAKGFSAFITTSTGTAVSTTPAEVKLEEGDKVKLAANATVYGSTKKFQDFVYKSTLYVREISGSRVVISTLKTGDVTGAVDKKYLTKI